MNYRGEKRAYNKKLAKNVIKHKDFILEKLEQEWKAIEKAAKRHEIYEKAMIGGKIVAKTILGLLAVGGILTIAAVAPNMFGIYGPFKKRGFFEKRVFNKTKYYLKRYDYVKFVESSDGKTIMKITDKGLAKVLTDKFHNFKINKPEKWDGYWRIIISDIPEKHRWARMGFREKLINNRFYQLQKSALITPFECEKEIEFLVSVFNISEYVRFIKTREIAPEEDIKKFFDLDL